MGWLEIIKTIADFGFITVAAGFVMWQIYNYIKHRNDLDAKEIDKKQQQDKNEIKNEELKTDRYEKMLDDMQTKQNDFYNLLMENQKRSDERFDKIIEQIIETVKQPHILTTEENNRMTKIDEEIDIFLEKTLVACNASRVSLIKYHNGGNDMLGNSILKMSMSNEKCAAGIIHILGSFQNQLRSFSTLLVKELNEKGICFIEDIENIKNIDNSIYQYLKQIGIKAKYAIAITNIKTNCVIGYMSIDFASNEHIDIEQVKHCLQDKKLKIEALLNL